VSKTPEKRFFVPLIACRSDSQWFISTKGYALLNNKGREGVALGYVGERALRASLIFNNAVFDDARFNVLLSMAL